jgi:hypothetical protein
MIGWVKKVVETSLGIKCVEFVIVYIVKGANGGRVQRANVKVKSRDCPEQ